MGLLSKAAIAHRQVGLECKGCVICIRSCPTCGLQPSLTETGIEGLWTPVLLYRLGYCDYSCNACGQSCPVGAIPPLSLEGKGIYFLAS